MKTNIIDQYSPQNTCQYEANRHVKYTSNNQSKIYPQDKICVSNELKRTVKTGDNQQVEFIYSLRNKRVTATVINESGEKKQVRSEDLPKELKQVDSPEKFKAFLRGAYTKVSTSSNGDYKLYVNQKGLGGMMSRSGSITPTTQAQNVSFHTSSLFEQQPQRLQELLIQVREDNLYFQESNISLSLFEQQCITNPDQVIFELHYQKGINPGIFAEVKEEVKQEEPQPQAPIIQDPLVKRFGINPEAVPGAVGYNITYDRLHYVEQEIFNLAIQELNTKSSAQALQFQRTIKDITFKTTFQILKGGPLTQIQEYPNNVVVVDIFARELGRIKATQTYERLLPETHTVVLWKKAEQEIVLIDPNKFEFSNHISTQQIQALTTLTISSIIPLRLEGDIVYGTQGKTTGYSEYTDPNPLPRDCIDIAVKIAFEINEQQKENIDIKQIEEKVFSQISNKLKLNSAVKKIDCTFIRELQSSNKDTRINAKQTLALNTMQEVLQVINKDIKNFANLTTINQIHEDYNLWKQSKASLEGKTNLRL